MRRAFIFYCVLVVSASSWASWHAARRDWGSASTGRAWTSGGGGGGYNGGYGGGFTGGGHK